MGEYHEVEIIVKTTCSNSKVKRAVLKKSFFSTDSKGRIRSFKNPTSALMSAVINGCISCRFKHGDVFWRIFKYFPIKGKRNLEMFKEDIFNGKIPEGE